MRFLTNGSKFLQKPRFLMVYDVSRKGSDISMDVNVLDLFMRFLE